MSKEGKRSADPELLKALSCGVSVEGAAGKAGVSVRTVRRRLRHPAFVCRLNRMRADMHLRMADQLTASGTEAVRTMVQLMQPSHPPGVRLNAAKSVVELGAKVRETADLAARLTDLEQRLAEKERKNRG